MSIFNDKEAEAIHDLAKAVGGGFSTLATAIHRLAVVAEPIVTSLDMIAQDLHRVIGGDEEAKALTKDLKDTTDAIQRDAEPFKDV